MNRIQGPRGREYPDHNPKSVALLGMGPSIQNYVTDTMTQELKPGFADEIWGINMVVNCMRCDLCFWMDDLEDQAKLTPHVLIATTKLKEVFNREKMAPWLQVAGEPLYLLTEMVHALPERTEVEKYEYVVEELKTLLNGPMQGMSYGSVRAILSMLDMDKKDLVPDPNRSLKGLIEVLDRNRVPVITSNRRTDVVKNSFDYPLDEIGQLAVDFFSKVYLSNGVAMAIAYAMWKGVESMRIYGCDFTYPNRNYAETGRACVESWIAYASSKGMKIAIAPNSSLIDGQGDIGVYGYAEQPEVYLVDGSILQYKKVPEMGGHFYRPQIIGKHAGVVNVVSNAAQADSASGPRADLLRGHADAGNGHAAHDVWARPGEQHPVHVP